MTDKRTALVLPGGGAKGIVTAGSLKAFHEAGIKYDAIYATSAGSLNAAVYHQGDLDKVIELWMTVENKDVYRNAFCHLLGKDAHLYDSTPLANLIDKYVDPSRLSENEIPITVYATEGIESRPFNLNEELPDDVRSSLLASASLPILFPPVYMRGMRLMDGGMGRNYPIMDAIDAGAELIIVLCPASRPRPRYGNLWQCVESLLESFSEGNLTLELESVQNMIDFGRSIRVVLVRPQPGTDFGGLLDFSKPKQQREELISLGYQTAKRAFIQMGLWQAKAPV